jgi:hypothetical protein
MAHLSMEGTMMKMKYVLVSATAATCIYIAGCGGHDGQNATDTIPVYQPAAQVFTDTTSPSVVNNRGAYVTSQCYTKTEDAQGNAHNPCFSCHINSEAPNYIDDWDLQENYAFSEYTRINRWTNLFKDRTAAVGAITDRDILGYVRSDNYLDANNSIILAELLQHLPDAWDNDHDGSWSGYTPDCYFHFDAEGFDIAPDGNLTGWRAFAYYPFLGTFWPTNGSTDDVLIRLPEVMQQNGKGVFDRTVYTINLAIVEALIKKTDIAIDPVDEALFGVDLNQNGVTDTADTVVYNWITPKYDFASKTYYDFSMHYVGRARQALIDNVLHMAPGLYPEHTEFLHTVRYIDLDGNGSVKMGSRMKELRYGRKTDWNSYAQLSNASQSEIKEKEAFPDRLRTIRGDAEHGLRTGLGWVYQGFIEDRNGHLRPQTYEETLYCIGCHSGIGAIADSTFVFQRKFDHNAPQKGWYHWTQHGLKGVLEPRLSDGRAEYRLYLQANGAGDEFRGNEEVKAKFFDADGNLIPEETAKIAADISYLLFPSPERALELNKAYKVIVDEQSFIYGRDAHVEPIGTVHRDVAVDTPTRVDVVKR